MGNISLKGGDNLFYPNIAAERAKRKMSIDDLAKRVGVTRKTIYLEKMADIFGCSIDYLLVTGTEDK